jgi:Fur family ferric uptake transcriptional regulator|tara:strand:+ start:435 stop:809 length:375 start_codon:yes stop_codon:yes gene_type:complete
MPRKFRNTIQKEIIHKEIKKVDNFFTAEDLYSIVKKKYPEVGLATIYRFLKNMRKEKRIHAYRCNNRLLYSRDKKSHCHFVCEETGKVVHFDVNSLDFLKNKIPGSISSFHIEVKGKCKECLQR